MHSLISVAKIKRIIRNKLLRRRFPQSVIHPDAEVDNHSILNEYSVLFAHTILSDSILGAYSYVQSGTAIYNADIGSYCSIAGSVTIGLAEHPTDMVSTSPVFYDNKQPLPRFFAKGRYFTKTLPRTTIGSDVWIGQGAMLKAGVTIGIGSVIGAGSIVTKDIPPYTIAAGNPCRPIRSRFSEEICQNLLESKWWEFSESKLSFLADFFSEPQSFLAELEQLK